MTTPVLNHFRSLGVTISRNGDKLLLEGPESIITDALKTDIRNQRAHIFIELSLSPELLNRNGKDNSTQGSSGSPPSEPKGTDEPKGTVSRNDNYLDVSLFISSTKTISEMKIVLLELTSKDMTTTDRSRLHANLIDHAKKLIVIEELDKNRTLEDIALICWNGKE